MVLPSAGPLFGLRMGRGWCLPQAYGTWGCGWPDTWERQEASPRAAEEQGHLTAEAWKETRKRRQPEVACPRAEGVVHEGAWILDEACGVPRG